MEHDGILGVRQPLIDLEPLSEPPAQEQQQQGTLQPPGVQHQAHEHGSLAGSPRRSAGGTGGQWPPGEGAAAVPPAPAPAFDPLGAVPHAVPSGGEQRHQAEQQQGATAGLAGDTEQLISFDGANGSLPAAPAPDVAAAAARSQLEDLLL